MIKFLTACFAALLISSPGLSQGGFGFGGPGPLPPLGDTFNPGGMLIPDPKPYIPPNLDFSSLSMGIWGVNTRDVCRGLHELTNDAKVTDLKCDVNKRTGQLTITHIRNGGHEVHYTLSPDEHKILASQVREVEKITDSYVALTRSKQWQEMSESERDLRRLENELSYMRFYSRTCGLGTGVAMGIVAASTYTLIKLPNVYAALGAVVGAGVYFGTSYCEEIFEEKIEIVKEKVKTQKDKVKREGKKPNRGGGETTTDPDSPNGGGEGGGEGGEYCWTSQGEVCTNGDCRPQLPREFCI